MRKQLAVSEEICLFIRLSLIRHSTKKGVFAYAEYYLMNVNSAKPAIKIITCEYSCLSSLLVARDVPGDVPSSEERGARRESCIRRLPRSERKLKLRVCSLKFTS